MNPSITFMLLCCFFVGLGVFVVLYNQRPHPFLRIIKGYISHTFKNTQFLCSLDSRLPIAYWRDATSRGFFRNPQRIYFELQHSFSLKEFEKMFAELCHRSRHLHDGCLEVWKITYLDHEHVAYVFRRSEDGNQIEYLLTIKQKKDKATSSTLHVLSIAWRVRR